jgi:uncharacterized protein with beta-barrel porin domain
VSSFSGNISNAGIITAKTAIAIADGTIQGQIVDSGTILASSYGIFVDSASKISTTKTAIVVNGATLAGGISNAGTISAASGRGMLLGAVFNVTGSTTFRTETIATFGGGISNTGTITASRDGILVGGNASLVGISNHATITISTFAGGISNTGTISAGGNGILVGGTATVAGRQNQATITISTFTNGISNNGTIMASGAGIEVGGSASRLHPASTAAVTISTFSGGITNSGSIVAKTGIVVDLHVLNFINGAIANSGTISGTGGTAIDVSGANNAITINQSAGSISGAIKLSANADILNVSGGTIAGNIIGSGSSDTVNFQLGAGTTYTDNNAFTGVNQVNINSGTVVLNGANSATNVDVFGTLAGSGSIDPTTVTIHSGGTFAPGTPGVPGTSMTITGNLAFQSGALYQIYLNQTASSYASVSGTASLAGTVSANFAGGLSKQYLILQSAGLGNSTFASLSTTNLPADVKAVLSYSTDDVFLDITASLPSTGLNVNQQNVANALNNFFNSGGALPPNFVTLFNLSGGNLANALTQLSGEEATDAEKGAYQLMNDFLNLMLDPTAGGGGGASGGGAPGFAPEQDASLPPDVALAYAKALKKQPQQSQQPQSFDQRWSAWGSAFGGTSRTDGDPVIGSNNVTASDYGFAAGMDYHATPNVTYGFGLAGGGTNWNLAQGLGNGRSDAFEAGVYAKTHAGPAYLSGALAFANHWFTTDRTVLSDQLQATFTGQSYAARLEGGYRYAVPITGAIVGVTPYAALQVQDFHTPSYSETDLTGGGFALSYNAMSATDTRSELGARFDNLQVVYGMPLVLRGRLAWAHDWVSNPSLGAVFQTLPGSNFTVNGAAAPKDSALTTAAAELHINANWTAIAKFDGEFGIGAQTYGGTGTLRYAW